MITTVSYEIDIVLLWHGMLALSRLDDLGKAGGNAGDGAQDGIKKHHLKRRKTQAVLKFA